MSRIPTARARGWWVPRLALLALLAADGAVAVTVHTWVDAAGVRHYADAPPAQATDAEAFEIAVSDPPTDAAADYYSVTNQWARVRAEREAAEARRAEIEAARAARAPAWSPPVVIERGGGWVLPYGGYGRPPRGLRHHPSRAHGGDRAGYVAARRRSDFAPTPVPTWPRERGGWSR